MFSDLPFIFRFISVFIFVINISVSASATASTESDHQSVGSKADVIALSIDNDLFFPGGADRDYTAGFALTFSGAGVRPLWGWPERFLKILDCCSNRGPDSIATANHINSFEFGGYGFTPDEIREENTRPTDRPYASLLYISFGRTDYDIDSASAWTSSFAVGMLGLDVFKAAQNRVHKTIGSDVAAGWEHQISEGGELTLRYQRAYHQYWEAHLVPGHYKTTYFGSVGYLTEVGVAFATRHGTISSPDYRFNPELISYGERTGELLPPSNGNKESYFWGGLAVKFRLYNAFLQGQFRSSDHTLGGHDVRRLVVDAWVGYTRSFGRDFQFSYVLRGNTSEIKRGEGDRSMFWGGFVLSHNI